MNPPQIANGNTKQLHDQLPPHPTALISNSDPASCVKEAERILGYSFLKPKLLEQALTHSSFSNGTASYERLEFVGDAALNLAMTNYLYLSHPDLGPGHISTLRSANVSTEKLARVAVRHRIYPLVLRNSPKLDKQVRCTSHLKSWTGVICYMPFVATNMIEFWFAPIASVMSQRDSTLKN